ncbi:MAG: MFS transporter [Merdimonas faecis]|uniref:MFS transporter n=1 Tax=Merdimonas faecis TaxID=1653435 RepID=UPI0022DFAE3B|nr:MFS transporter [Merdimonas faecis]
MLQSDRKKSTAHSGGTLLYALFYAVTLLSAVYDFSDSSLKKRFRMKSLFMTAIILFIIGTVLAAVTPVFSLLLLGRLIQGVGTGIALPLMFNITMEQVPEEKLGVMMGTASLITAMAPAVGPSLGGFIVNHFGWRIVFILLCLHAGSNCFPVSAFTSSLHWDKDVP